MSEPPILDPITSPPVADTQALQTCAPLIGLIGMAQMQATYEATVLSKVINAVDLDNGTLENKHRNHLLASSAIPVLTLIWKESKFVTDDDLACVGAKRLPKPNSLTAYGLAGHFEGTGKSFGAMHKRMTAIADAACAYGLIEKYPVAANRVELRGTALLDDVMRLVGRRVNGVALNMAARQSGES